MDCDHSQILKTNLHYIFQIKIQEVSYEIKFIIPGFQVNIINVAFNTLDIKLDLFQNHEGNAIMLI